MNSLFNSALKQSTSIRRDLDAFALSPSTAQPAQLGAISTTLTSFSRTLDDYGALSRNELDAAKKEKAADRLKNFRSDLSSYRTQFDQLKKEREAAVHLEQRTELSGRRPHNTATPENPYAQPSQQQQQQQNHHSPTQNSWAPARSSADGGGGGGLSFGSNSASTYQREEHALREQTFFSAANSQLDEFLDRGRAVLGDLSQQREILKGTQRRLYSVANTLGVSGDTIRMVERRAKQDKWIFWAGVVVFVLFCWAVIHFLR